MSNIKEEYQNDAWIAKIETLTNKHEIGINTDGLEPFTDEFCNAVITCQLCPVAPTCFGFDN